MEWFNQACIWLVRLESELPPSVGPKEVVANRVPVLLQGMLFARSISNLIQDTINLHSFLGSPLSKKIVSSLCQLIETVKVASILVLVLPFFPFLSSSIVLVSAVN